MRARVLGCRWKSTYLPSIRTWVPHPGLGGKKGRRRKEGVGRKEKKKDILLQPSTMNTKYKHLIQLTGVSLPLSGYHLVG